MIKRVCKKCKTQINEHKCTNPACGGDAVTVSSIFWCESCNVPLFDETCSLCGNIAKYISSDMRPVFPEESTLLAIINNKEADYYAKKSVWYGSNSYIVDGKKVKVSITELNRLLSLIHI